MDEIYKKLKVKYPNYKVNYNKNEKLIEIIKETLKVEIFDDTILLFVDDSCITHTHTTDLDEEKELYETIEYYLKDYKQITNQYKKQSVIRKMIFIFPVILLALILIILIFISGYKKQNYYQELKNSIQEDISNYIKISSPYCSVGSGSSTIDEEILMVQAGIDKKKFLDVDGKSYCKVKVSIRCVAENEHEWDTYLKCKDYEDKEFNH